MKNGDHYMVRLRKDISFFSKLRLKKIFEDGPIYSKLIIDLAGAEFLDQAIIDTISEYMAHSSLKKVEVT